MIIVQSEKSDKSA